LSAHQHDTKVFKKLRNTPAKCALCQQDHLANYKGCAVYRELVAARNKPPRGNQQHPEPDDNLLEDEDEAIPEREKGIDAVGVEGVEPLPTDNLLGWAPAVRLTNEQRQISENCGVQEAGFADHLARFALNNGLFEAIPDRVSVCR
jgi:hypothetical protein